MPVRSEEPLSRQELMLFTEDKRLMEAAYGRGWTSILRQLLRQYVKDHNLRERYGRDDS